MLTELEPLDLYSLMGNFMSSLASQVVEHHPMVRGTFDETTAVDGKEFPLDPAGTRIT